MMPLKTLFAGPLERWANALLPGPAERKRRRAIRLFEQSPLFDRDWYLDHYPDVAGSGIDPVRHYLIFGWQEGRDPGPDFSTTAYLRANADVAAMGLNPLLHFLEHGHAEGRGAPDHAAPPRKSVVPPECHEPAGPCASFPRTARPAVRWRRHARPSARPGDLVTIDGHFVGEHRDDQSRDNFAAAFESFAHLSGVETGPGSLEQPGSLAQAAHLLDGWYAGQGVFRTRWQLRSGDTLVVRAIQFSGSGPSLVGEGLVTSRLDLFDAKLDNPYFPILFVFVDEQGWIEAWQLLVFPSLCRGGLHYPELLAAGGANGIDALNSRSIERLASINQERSVPLIASFEVDLRGADGTHPLFQPDFQHWLRRVARLSIRPKDPLPEAGLAYLADAVRIQAERPRATGDFELTLTSDMVPTLASVTEECGSGHHALDTVSFIVSGEERSCASSLIRVPNDLPDELPDHFVPIYPRLNPIASGSSQSQQLPVLAIRMPRSRSLSEAEILVPIAAPFFAPPQSEAVTFIIPVAGRPEDELLEALRSLALQTGTGPRSILFVGDPPASVSRLATRLFSSVQSAADISNAAALTGTALVGYLEPGVLLHDRRTVAFLTDTLSDPVVASASVVLVSAEPRGKGWIVAPVDAGEFAATDGEAHPDLALPLWRATVPQIRPPQSFWITRKANLEAWVASAGTASGRHLCTSLLTASVRSVGQPIERTLQLPPASVSAGMQTLVG